jgi:carboxypeptidase C (cathepsin A)
MLFRQLPLLAAGALLFACPNVLTAQVLHQKPGAGEKAAENTETKADDETAPAKKDKEEKKPKPGEADLKSITEGKITLGGEEITFEAETNTIELLNDKDEPTAAVFYVHYRRTGVESPEKRPLLFCFNGGPGSSAVWLHIGGLGPRRVVLPGDGTVWPKPPFALEDNPDCLLDAADLVFVDPVNTGFSRAAKDKDPKQFFGYQEDVGYLTDFIRRFVSDHDRWASPKYLLGESYGALRVAALADSLQERTGMYLNGVVLLSGLLDFKTLIGGEGNDLPYLCFLPAMSASAKFHGKLPGSPAVEKLMAEAREFAFGEYAVALLAGSGHPEAKRKTIAARLEKLTSIPAAIWIKADLRLDPSVFRKLLLSDKGYEIGRFDARVKAPAANPLSPVASSDPSFDLAIGVFSTTINDYLRRDLKARTPRGYEVLSRSVQPWKFGAENSYMRVDERLVSAMRSNPHLRVLVQCGHYDLATPPDAIGYSIARLDLPETLRANISTENYEGGHMFYTNREASAKMREDLLKFLQP